MFSFALIAHHDLLQEDTLRFLGPALKNLYCPLHVIATRGVYPARVYLRPAPEALLHPTHRRCSTLPLAQPEVVGRLVARCAPRGGAPPPAALSDAPWHVLEDDLIALCAINTPLSGVDSKLAPHARVDDGCVDVFVLRGVWGGLPCLDVRCCCGMCVRVWLACVRVRVCVRAL